MEFIIYLALLYLLYLAVKHNFIKSTHMLYGTLSLIVMLVVYMVAGNFVVNQFAELQSEHNSSLIEAMELFE